ncbi:MAG: MarR family transcriptional regulator [Bacteroidales bacterium]|jgi:MarR family transcriptional regulator, organic hydroperoxide resistance regulator|nr:MarR family transcriptional regulator [Eubacteriales bacterium]MDD4669972.1 MarR family transcriptional regulator [Bacteroidales bacterium]
MERLCKIREIQHNIAAFEKRFVERYGICLNEGMILCSLLKSDHGTLTSGELSELLGLSHSNTSKVIASLENKLLIERTFCENDKRKMCFSLTSEGSRLIQSVNCDELGELPL